MAGSRLLFGFRNIVEKTVTRIMVRLPPWIPAVVARLIGRLRPNRPKLTVEIRQVCFDKILASLEPDWSDYRIDLYLFLYVWAVNTQQVPTTVKQWKLAVLADGQKIEGERVEDISKWHQHSTVNSVQHGFQVEDIREPANPFPARPLHHGILSEGWVCFIVRKTKESLMENATITLTATDSFGCNYPVEGHAPWTCKGNMVNPAKQSPAPDF